MTGPVRWGVLGTANIAARAFLPAVRAAGDVAVAVGSRTPGRAEQWAAENELQRTGDYQAIVDADDLDAIYVALPNDQHVTWAAAAARSGKAVLCEKPLGLTVDEVAWLTDRVRGHGPVWEAFVFAFHPQTRQVLDLLAAGEIGELRQIDSEFHFLLNRPDNIRWRAELGGGALFDVGCYPIRLARLLFAAEPVTAAGSASWAPSGVDSDMAAVLDFPHSRRLVMSAGLARPASTFTRIAGSTGEIRVRNPFHPTPTDGVQLWRDGRVVSDWPAAAGTAFEHAVRHVHAVLRDGARPRHTVAEDSYDQARALQLVRDAITDQPTRTDRR